MLEAVPLEITMTLDELPVALEPLTTEDAPEELAGDEPVLDTCPLELDVPAGFE